MTDPQQPWWRDAVVYQLYIRSFADGDGDAIGDIAGIRSRLPYLRDLGVDAVWINPLPGDSAACSAEGAASST